jgi:hypothetical protein
LLLGVCLASASTLQVLTLDDMTAQSSAVVHAHVLAAHADWSSPKKNSVMTRYTFKADRYLKGNLGSTFELIEPGGTMGMLTTSVPGAPVYQVGEEIILFVWTVPGTNVYRTIGFEQGAFRVKRDAATGTFTVSHSQPLAGGGQFVDSEEFKTAARNGGTSRNLSEFLGQVASSLRRVAASQAGAKQ